MNLHKLHTMQNGWTIKGQVEVRITTELLRPIVEVEEEVLKISA